MVTIGVYDSFYEACVNGNNLLKNLESKFDIHKFPNGRKSTGNTFSKNGGPFGSKNDLVTNLAYLKTPFEFYAKITTLKYDDIDETISEILEARKRFVEYKNSQQD